ncbi:MAG: RNA 2',3'-cyclic phosphodiesterase [Acidobacteria bacterium]|nr:RNA 2',3'-cyclic phosphodiesterase [Acidobacteriota bacterium]
MRTFIAIPLPQDCRRLLEKLQSSLRETGAEVRWTAVASIHLTLKFLGEMDAARLEPTALALLEACGSHQAFPLSLGGLGAFPGASNPRVVWCGVRGEIERLSRLQADVEDACARLGFPREARPYHPHLTLGRVKGRRNLHSLTECITIGSNLESGFTADRCHLYRSSLTPRGAIYEVLKTVQLPA